MKDKLKSLFIQPGKKMIVHLCVCAVMLVLLLSGVYSQGFSAPWFFGCLALIVATAIVLNLDIPLDRWKGILTMILLPPISFYLLEAYSHNAFSMSVSLQILNILFFYVMFAFFFFIIGKASTASIISCIIPTIVGIANYYTVCFRGTPILPWDLLSIRTAMSVTNSYSFAMEYEMLTPTYGFILLISIAAKITIRLPKLRIKKPTGAVLKVKALVTRIVGTVVSVCLVVALFFGLQNESFTDYLDMNETLFTPNTLYATNGFAVSFIYDLQFIHAEKPDDYSLTRVEEIMDSYTEEAEEEESSDSSDDELESDSSDEDTDVSTDADEETEVSIDTDENEEESVLVTDEEDTSDYPNIIVIMDEAFSDLSVLGDFETNEDYMPFISSLTENTVKGNLYMSVKGGNTANSEFEFLTGDSMAFLPQGSVAYQQFIQEETPSLASWLASLGYSTTAMHPYNASGWDRDEVYPFFGFEDMLFYPDFTYREKVRAYISDESAFDQIIDLYENKDEDTPMFVFEVTMQNHGGYYKQYDNFTSDIEILGETSDATHKSYTEQYLSLIKITDEAFEGLIDYFSEVDEDTIIVFFGDHQPTDLYVESVLELSGNLDDDSLEAEVNRYIVPFVIWANYDIEEEEIERLSANYLASLMLDIADLPMSDYQEYLLDLSEVLPVICASVYIDADGNYYNTDDNPYADLINEYQTLQYYMLFDSDDSLSDFYGVTPEEVD